MINLRNEARRLKELAETVREHNPKCSCTDRWRLATLNLCRSADVVADAVLLDPELKLLVTIDSNGGSQPPSD